MPAGGGTSQARRGGARRRGGDERLRNAETIVAVGRRMGAGRKAIRAALEAGLVESNLRNVNYGDRDSLGVFQQRPSQGWGTPAQVRNVEYAAEQFFKRAIPIASRYGSAGQLAQAVQRSAFPGKYDQRRGDAIALERQLGVSGGGGGGGAGGGGSSAGGTVFRPGESGFTGVEQLNLASLLDQLKEQQRPQVPVTAPQSPLDARQALPLPQGYQQPVSAPGVPQAPESSSDLLSLVSQLTAARGEGIPSGGSTETVPGGGGGGGGGGGDAPASRRGRGTAPARGRLIGAPHQGTHTLGNWQSDNAVDIAGDRGGPIYAVADGVVEKVNVRPDGGGRFAGSSITIRTRNNGYFYAHLADVDVRPGQRVRRGQRIGGMGSANGVVHLHFGRERGDPRNLL